MKNVVLVLAAVALLAVGGWFVFGRGGEVASSPGPALEQGLEVEALAPDASAPLATPETEAPLADGAAATERTEVEVEEPVDATAAAADAPDPAQRLRVRVVATTGEALPDIEVQFVERRANWDDVQQRATTGADGIATFESVDLSASGQMTFGLSAALFVRVDVLAAERVDVALEPAMLGDVEPIELRLPATGSVVVNVLDVDHGAPLGEVSVKLWHVPEGESRTVSPFANSDRTWVEVTAEDGVARFPFVACGLDVNAVATRDLNVVTCRSFGAGPLRPGDEVRLETRFGEVHPVVQLRALDESGVPIVEESFAIEVEGTGGFMPTEHEIFPRSDAEGLLRIDLEVEPDADVSRSLTMKGPWGASGGERPFASVELPGGLPNGLTDLGDVTFGAAPLFISGRVVDDTGRPLPNLKLRLERQEEVDQGWWDNDYDFEARSDDDGRFEVRGTRFGERFRVTAKSDDHASRWTEFEPGAADVLVELTQPGGLAGRLLVDPHIDPTVLELRLESGPDEEFVDGSIEMTKPSKDGSFEFGNLLTGSGRKLVVRTNMVWRELATVEDLDVVAGQVLRDVRMDPLDLRGKLFVHELVVVGGDESDRFSGQLQFARAGEEELSYQGYMSGRSMTMVTSFERMDLKTKFRGYRSIELKDVGGRIELPLRKSLEVTIVLLGGAKLPEPPIFVKAGLVPVGGGHSDLDLGGDPFDERGESRTKAPGVGSMEVHWILERRLANGGFATSFAPPEPRYVEVLEGVEGQRFEITVTQEELDEIVARLP